MKLFLLLLLGALLCSCAQPIAVPSDFRQRLAEQGDKPPLRKVLLQPRETDLSGNKLWGIPKANPRWWWLNADTPVEPWWRPEEPLDERKRSWRRRNPLHNFTHYVIGVADRPCIRYGLAADQVWHPSAPMNLAVTSCHPLVWLPFVSYRGLFLEGYVGWRSGGNFGLALRRSKAPWRWPQ